MTSKEVRIMKTNGKYILEGKKVVVEHDLIKWASWLETAERHIADDRFGKVRISTAFLGVDHNFSGGKPILFETMIFGGKHDGYQERYHTWEEAERGHKKAIKLLK
jgi:hypothetical protein